MTPFQINIPLRCLDLNKPGRVIDVVDLVAWREIGPDKPPVFVVYVAVTAAQRCLVRVLEIDQVVAKPVINGRWIGKGSLKNKFAFSGVEAPAWQGARRANSRLFNRRATQPWGMDRPIKIGSYFWASPKQVSSKRWTIGFRASIISIRYTKRLISWALLVCIWPSGSRKSRDLAQWTNRPIHNSSQSSRWDAGSHSKADP